MYVADESDASVYTYNMPDAIDARLASLTLGGVDIGEFDHGPPNHEWQRRREALSEFARWRNSAPALPGRRGTEAGASTDVNLAVSGARLKRDCQLLFPASSSSPFRTVQSTSSCIVPTSSLLWMP